MGTVRKSDALLFACCAVLGWGVSEALGPGTLVSWLLLAVVTITAATVWVIYRRTRKRPPPKRGPSRFER